MKIWDCYTFLLKFDCRYAQIYVETWVHRFTRTKISKSLLLLLYLQNYTFQLFYSTFSSLQHLVNLSSQIPPRSPPSFNLHAHENTRNISIAAPQLARNSPNLDLETHKPARSRATIEEAIIRNNLPSRPCSLGARNCALALSRRKEKKKLATRRATTGEQPPPALC